MGMALLEHSKLRYGGSGGKGWQVGSHLYSCTGQSWRGATPRVMWSCLRGEETFLAEGLKQVRLPAAGG